MPGKKELSLLPDEANLNTPLARLLRWLTTVGRFVIVFTELIVISAFLSRFWLDRKNSDLSEIIRQQKAILASTADFEKDYSLLQSRLQFIDTFIKKQPDYPGLIKSLVNTVPEDIFFQSFNLSQGEVDPSSLTSVLSLYTYREDSIVNFITNLTLNPDIDSVNIRRIEKKAKDNKYYVDISLTFKKNEPLQSSTKL
jgi:Tfp pilus assembly protein PilN